MNSSKNKDERRVSDRFRMECDVRYRVLNSKLEDWLGVGRTVNMGSSGVLFTTDGLLIPGGRLELAISWPVFLNDKVALKLVVRARVVRREGGMAAAEIQQYEFRTQGRSPHANGAP
jgi:hypothetical protein